MKTFDSSTFSDHVASLLLPVSDVDECFPLTSPCSTNDHCINTPGSYKCLCRADLEEPFCEAGRIVF